MLNSAEIEQGLARLGFYVKAASEKSTRHIEMILNIYSILRGQKLSRNLVLSKRHRWSCIPIIWNEFVPPKGTYTELIRLQRIFFITVI